MEKIKVLIADDHTVVRQGLKAPAGGRNQTSPSWVKPKMDGRLCGLP